MLYEKVEVKEIDKFERLIPVKGMEIGKNFHWDKQASTSRFETLVAQTKTIKGANYNYKFKAKRSCLFF